MQHQKRIHICIMGRVQGVGFRPYVYRVAKKYNLSGWICNDADGVALEVQGENVEKFIGTLRSDLPPLAEIDAVFFQEIPLHEIAEGFSIIPSKSQTNIRAQISPDVCICQDCIKELFDENSRFYLYPFLNCTNCGPRFTIVENLPYDRDKTTMSSFKMCADCEQEYQDPSNRRYHAQPTACAKCGPALSHSVQEIAADIKVGKIVAIKGMGGYQLICDAKNFFSVRQLRQRKQRDEKPFALMLLNMESIHQLVKCNNQAETLLKSWHRPIVLLQKKANLLSDGIARGLEEYGVMLPSTPLHYLIFHALLNMPKGGHWLAESNEIVLVATSANPKDCSLIIDDKIAQERLQGIADKIVSYNRNILTRADDSVMRIIDSAPYFIRRARGYVPLPIKLSREMPEGIAVGGYLKNTFCVTRGREAYVSQYIGDIDSADTIHFFTESLNHFLKLLDVNPKFIAHDLHPDFYTTRFAQTSKLPAYAIQHHQAHLASVIAECHIDEPLLGVVLDGYGYGEKGEAWGGELFFVNELSFKRISHLRPLYLLGGDKAARQPWRMAAAMLYQLGREDEIRRRFSKKVDIGLLLKLLAKETLFQYTSSCGRLFDAASALLGVCEENQYEAQAAMLLESLVTDLKSDHHGWRIKNHELDLFPLMEQMVGMAQIEGANLFHGTLISALADWIDHYSRQEGINTIVLSGGCFLNRVLLENLIRKLKKQRKNVFVPRQLPPNDGGISLGQIWIASHLWGN